jgi:ABC-type transport system substrate-binding protein
MDDAVEEPNPVAREQLYYQIQERMIEKLYPSLWCTSQITHTAWAPNVKGIPLKGTYIKILFKDGYFV